MNDLYNMSDKEALEILNNFEAIGEILKMEYDSGDGDDDFYRIFTSSGDYELHTTGGLPPRTITKSPKVIQFNVDYVAYGGPYIEFIRVKNNAISEDNFKPGTPLVDINLPQDEKDFLKQYVQDIGHGSYAVLAKVDFKKIAPRR